MTLLDLLNKAANAGNELRDFLTYTKQKYPDSAAKVDEILAKLSIALDPSNLAAVAAVILEEIKDIAQGKIVRKDHPSDAA